LTYFQVFMAWEYVKPGYWTMKPFCANVPVQLYKYTKKVCVDGRRRRCIGVASHRY
jgi:hypothetical protein